MYEGVEISYCQAWTCIELPEVEKLERLEGFKG